MGDEEVPVGAVAVGSNSISIWAEAVVEALVISEEATTDSKRNLSSLSMSTFSKTPTYSKLTWAQYHNFTGEKRFGSFSFTRVVARRLMNLRKNSLQWLRKCMELCLLVLSIAKKTRNCAKSSQCTTVEQATRLKYSQRTHTMMEHYTRVKWNGRTSPPLLQRRCRVLLT
jgi:hypothetical protein